MKETYKYNSILFLSLPLVIGVILASTVGLFTPDFYIRETPNWQAQSVGQDFIDLFVVVPVLLISALFAYRGHRAALLIWAGANLYLIYTFCLYCFDVHFNSLFLLYCINLGLAFYSFLYFIYIQAHRSVITFHSGYRIVKITGYYFIILSVIFYATWLGEIVPAILNNTIPKSLQEVGLTTNGVHVIDLSVFLPGLFIIGVMLLRKNNIGLILAPVCLVFMVLMDITIGGLVLIMKERGLESNIAVAVVMGVFAMVSLLMLILFLKSIIIESKDHVPAEQV